jgi:hypothetical protein
MVGIGVRIVIFVGLGTRGAAVPIFIKKHRRGGVHLGLSAKQARAHLQPAAEMVQGQKHPTCFARLGRWHLDRSSYRRRSHWDFAPNKAMRDRNLAECNLLGGFQLSSTAWALKTNRSDTAPSDQSESPQRHRR